VRKPRREDGECRKADDIAPATEREAVARGSAPARPAPEMAIAKVLALAIAR